MGIGGRWRGPEAGREAVGRAREQGPRGSGGRRGRGGAPLRERLREGRGPRSEGEPRGAEAPRAKRGKASAAGETCGWEAPLRRQGSVRGWPGRRGRREQAGHKRGCASLGRFDDRPPFPSSPPSLSLSWLSLGGGGKDLPCEQVLGLGDRQERLEVSARLSSDFSQTVAGSQKRERRAPRFPSLPDYPERSRIAEGEISVAEFQRFVGFRLHRFSFQKELVRGESCAVVSRPTQLQHLRMLLSGWVMERR